MPGSRSRKAAVRLSARTHRTTSRSTLRLTAEDRASAPYTLDDLGEALFDGHPADVVPDRCPGGDLGVVGDEDGGGGGASRPRPVTMSWRTVPG